MGFRRFTVLLACLSALGMAFPAFAADAAAKKEPSFLSKIVKSNDMLSEDDDELIPEALEKKADQDDERADRVDAPELMLNLSNTPAHGVRERIRRRGVVANPVCLAAKKDDPSCYCASTITIPVFSKRVYPVAARALNYNIWEYLDEVLDTPYCPLEYTQNIKGEPEAFKETAGIALFQRVEVPLFNKQYLSLVHHVYEREGKDVLELDYGILVDLVRKRGLGLPDILGGKQDAALTKFVNAELKKQDPKATALKFSGGDSDDIDAFYLAPEGVVLQFAGGSISDKEGVLRVVIPAEMIVHSGARQLIQP